MISAVKWGAIVGVAAYLLLGLGLTALGTVAFGGGTASVDANPAKLALACTDIFLLLFAFSAAGYLTGRETLVAGRGAIAGMVAFVVYAALLAVYTPGGPVAPAGNGAGGFIAATLVPALLGLGVGALMGWIGGRPGAQRALKAARTKQG